MNKKIIAVISSITILTTLLVGCAEDKITGKSEKNNEIKSVKLIVPDGLPSIALSKLIKDDKKIGSVNIESAIEKTTEALTSDILKGEPDIAVVPSNLAAQAYNKGIGYQIVGTVGWGSMFLVSSDPEIKTIDSVRGKEVCNIGRGLTPDIVFKGALKNKGIDAQKELNFSYVSAASELPPLLISGKAKIAVVPEPALSAIEVKKKDLRIISDLNEEWKTILSSQYGFPQSTLIVKERLLKTNKDFVDKFIKSVEQDINWVTENKKEAASISKELGITINNAIIPKALEKANIKFVNIKETKSVYKKYFEKLKEFEPKNIGGKVPDEKIFGE